VVGGVLSLVGGVALLFLRGKLNKIMGEVTSFSAGVLIGVAVLDLLPESLVGGGDTQTVAWLVLSGILFLFILEKTRIWFHHHHEPHGVGPDITGVWLGDTLHNLIDGMAIGAGFLISPKVGIATAIAVGMHELPQEIADFGLYLRAGFKSTKTIMLNILSSLSTIIGGVFVYLWGAEGGGIEHLVLPFTAGMFLYIALADLVPDLHTEQNKNHVMAQIVFLFAGIAGAFISISLLE